MSTTPFVAAAYAVFALILAWDYVAPRFKHRRVRRAILLRARREAARKSA